MHEPSLDADDKVLYIGYLSWWAYVPQLISASVLIVVGAAARVYGEGTIFQHLVWVSLAGFLLGLEAVLVKQSVQARVTDHHVLVRRKLVSLHTVTLNLHRVESVDIGQSIFQRIGRFGDVVIRGVGTEDVVLPGVKYPEALKHAVLSSKNRVDF